MEFIKKWYFKYFKIKNENYDEIFFNNVYNRNMFVKTCDICNYKIYMFDYTTEFKQHQIECYKFHFINKRQIKFN